MRMGLTKSLASASLVGAIGVVGMALSPVPKAQACGVNESPDILCSNEQQFVNDLAARGITGPSRRVGSPGWAGKSVVICTKVVRRSLRPTGSTPTTPASPPTERGLSWRSPSPTCARMPPHRTTFRQATSRITTFPEPLEHSTCLLQ